MAKRKRKQDYIVITPMDKIKIAKLQIRFKEISEIFQLHLSAILIPQIQFTS